MKATLGDANTHYLVNATHEDYLIVESNCDKKVNATAYNTMGDVVYEKELSIASGIQKITVPESGLLVLS